MVFGDAFWRPPILLRTWGLEEGISLSLEIELPFARASRSYCEFALERTEKA